MPYCASARLIPLILATVFVSACTLSRSEQLREPRSVIQNPVSYFEIPVTDMERAIAFYQAVFGQTLERTVIDGHDMALFPFDEDGQGITGALAKGDSYTPSITGPRIYFFVDSIEDTLNKVISLGGSIAYPKTLVGDFWVAEFVDSEGNQIALSSTDN